MKRSLKTGSSIGIIFSKKMFYKSNSNRLDSSVGALLFRQYDLDRFPYQWIIGRNAEIFKIKEGVMGGD
jgi:hypothetical protein